LRTETPGSVFDGASRRIAARAPARQVSVGLSRASAASKGTPRSVSFFRSWRTCPARTSAHVHKEILAARALLCRQRQNLPARSLRPSRQMLTAVQRTPMRLCLFCCNRTA
jgi:hypothetical protein